jgi:hypothetical protein
MDSPNTVEIRQIVHLTQIESCTSAVSDTAFASTVHYGSLCGDSKNRNRLSFEIRVPGGTLELKKRAKIFSYY